ncbi:hypothetical protein GCM10029978_048100 [Actinoallomurus acanthiterrae]
MEMSTRFLGQRPSRGRRRWLPLIGLLILSALLAVHGPEDAPSTAASPQSIVLSLVVRSADAGPSAMRVTATDGYERLPAERHHSPAKTPQEAGQICLALLALTFLLAAGGADATRERPPVVGAPASAGTLRREDHPPRPPGILQLSVLRL